MSYEQRRMEAKIRDRRLSGEPTAAARRLGGAASSVGGGATRAKAHSHLGRETERPPDPKGERGDAAAAARISAAHAKAHPSRGNRTS